jgi:glycosyltransferase involved in cell wall biosynthesis
MPRILNVLYEERFGGPQSRVLQVATRLQAKGFETLVVIPKGDPTFASRLKAVQIPFHEFDLVRLRDSRNPAVHARFIARFWPNVMTLRRLIRDYKIELVHTNGLIHLQAPIAAGLEGVPLVWHLNDVNTPRLLRLLLLPLVRRWADQIVVAAQAVGYYYFPNNASSVRKRLHVLYAPVDTEKFRTGVDGTSVRATLGIDDDSPIVGTVKNLSPGAGVEFLIDAASDIKRHFPKAKFLIVGEKLRNRQAYWSSLMRRTEELGLANDVIFVGRRDDIPEVMRAMTVYVHPSEAEACPMAVLEASASGLPVIATDVGGTRELVEDGVTGILVEPRSPAQIADAVVHLLESPETAQAMGMRGVQRMRELFSLDACVREHIRVYTAALQQASASRRFDS